MDFSYNYRYLIYFIIFKICLKYYLCTPHHEMKMLHDLKKTKADFTINSEEILRRRKSIQSYLSELANAEKDWIETYHLSFQGSKNVAQKTTEHKHSAAKHDYTFDDTTAYQNLNSFALDYSETVKHESNSYYSEPNPEKGSETSYLNRIKLPDTLVDLGKPKNAVSPDEAITMKKNIYSSVSDSSKSEENDIGNNHLSNDDDFSNSMETTLDSLSNKNFPTDTENSHLNPGYNEQELVSNSFRKYEKDVSNDKNSDDTVDLINHKTIIPSSLEFTEAEKNNFESHHWISKNEIFFDKRKDNTDLLSETKSTVKHEGSCVRKKMNFYLTKTCDPMKLPHFISKKSNEKMSNSKFEKCKESTFNSELNSNSENLINVHKIKDPLSESSSTEKDLFSRKINNNEHSLLETNIFNSKLHGRQKLINSYLSMLNEAQENWIETYHYSYLQGGSEIKERFTPVEVFDNHNYINSESEFSNSNIKKSKHSLYNYAENTEEKSKLTYPKEKLYFIRWVNKLLSKYTDNAPNHYSNIIFSFSPESLNILKEISSSKNFDVVVIDELICGLISNSTLHNKYDLSSFYDFMPKDMFSHLVLGVVLLACFTLYYFPNLKFLCVPVVMFLCSIAWNAWKMYQQKIAEKQAMMSSIDSSYCESILTQESGIMAHVKETIRHYWYNEECKKYYAALMVDPLSEIPVTVIAVDLISNTFFHVFQVFGRFFNTFYKDLIYGISFTEKLFFWIIFITVLLFCVLLLLVYQKYKLNLPFFMGSIEPSKPHMGSQVEDVKLDNKKNDLQNSPGLPQVSITNIINLPDDCNEKVKSIQNSPDASKSPELNVIKLTDDYKERVKSYTEQILPQSHKKKLISNVPMITRRSSF